MFYGWLQDLLPGILKIQNLRWSYDLLCSYLSEFRGSFFDKSNACWFRNHNTRTCLEKLLRELLML